MTIKQALDVFDPDKKRPTLQIQRQAFAVLEKALAPLSDSTEAEGEPTKTQNNER